MLYPLRANEAERLRHLRELCIVGTTPSAVLDQICTFAQELLGAPMVAVTLLDEDVQWLHSESGLGIDSMPRERAFCNHTILGEVVMVVADALDDARFATNPLVTGELAIRFYAGAPLAI
jgi:GAF domain-containing protein